MRNSNHMLLKYKMSSPKKPTTSDNWFPTPNVLPMYIKLRRNNEQLWTKKKQINAIYKYGGLDNYRINSKQNGYMMTIPYCVVIDVLLLG